LKVLAFLRNKLCIPLQDIKAVGEQLPLKVAEGTLSDVAYPMKQFNDVGAKTEIRPLMAR
jgi:hypothetical protein